MSDGHTETRHRSKKDTKRWCRGTPGREHEYEVVIEPHHFGLKLLPVPCHWRLIFMRGEIDRPHVTWSCRHILRCVLCGRKFRLKERCPNYHEPPEGEVAEWLCAECGHPVGAPHGTRLEPCVEGCGCRRFWLYPKGQAER